MSHLHVSFAVLACAVLAGCAAEDSPVAPVADERGDLSEKIAEYMEATAALGHFSGAVLVARGGYVLHRAGYGYSDIPKREPVTAETRFRIASITKQFTAAALLRLQERGLLDLDDPIEQFDGDAPQEWSGITLRQLLNHTSGIADYEEILGMASDAYHDFMMKPGFPRRAIDVARSHSLNFEPGSEFRYCNSSYVLLGLLIEQLSGRGYEEFLRESFFEPLGMTSTGHDRYDLELANRASGYELREGWTSVDFFAGYELTGDLVVPARPIRMEPPMAEGGLYSTVDDLYRWSRALHDGKILEPASLETMTTAGLGDYGLGLFIGEREGQRRIWHTGVIPGFISVLDQYPDADATVVVLGNTDVSVGRISDDLAAILFGGDYGIPRPHRLTEITEAQFEPLAGSYRTEDDRIYEVYWDDMPAIEMKDRFIAGMYAKSPTEFYVPMFRGPIRFESGADGKIARLVAEIHGRTRTATRID